MTKYVEVDGGFSCVEAGVYELYGKEADQYFLCSHGKHFIDGQLDENGNYVGVTFL